jgi:hypothetical protein
MKWVLVRWRSWETEGRKARYSSSSKPMYLDLSCTNYHLISCYFAAFSAASRPRLTPARG